MWCLSSISSSLFLSTPSARRATRGFQRYGTGFPISIHALREEGDRRQRRGCTGGADFYPRPPRGGRHTPSSAPGKAHSISIHALREEGDTPDLIDQAATALFLSTPSARRATGGSDEAARAVLISIHALREEGDRLRPAERQGADAISIHALREEGDSTSVGCVTFWFLFLSTPSARRATLKVVLLSLLR